MSDVIQANYLITWIFQVLQIDQPKCRMYQSMIQEFYQLNNQ